MNFVRQFQNFIISVFYALFPELGGPAFAPDPAQMRSRAKDKILVTVILMVAIVVVPMGLVISEDARESRVYDYGDALIAGVSPVFEAFDSVAFDKAPNVVGMKEAKAKKKLKGFTVKIKHQKMTYQELVENTKDTLFFGEVTKQSQNRERVAIQVPTADTSDALTQDMVSLGGRLAWPLPGRFSLSSRFGPRSSPGGIGSTYHQGIDIPAASGTAIIAALKGTVETAGGYGGYGNCVIINHGNGFKTLYGHMSMINCNVGDQVKAGDVIGKVGSTGASTGPHLHFGLMKDGSFVDPMPYLTGRQDLQAGSEVAPGHSDVTAGEPAEASDASQQDDADDASETEPAEEDEAQKEETKKKSDKATKSTKETKEAKETKPSDPTGATSSETKDEKEPDPTQPAEPDTPTKAPEPEDPPAEIENAEE